MKTDTHNPFATRQLTPYQVDNVNNQNGCLFYVSDLNAVCRIDAPWREGETPGTHDLLHVKEMQMAEQNILVEGFGAVLFAEMLIHAKLTHAKSKGEQQLWHDYTEKVNLSYYNVADEVLALINFDSFATSFNFSLIKFPDYDDSDIEAELIVKKIVWENCLREWLTAEHLSVKAKSPFTFYLRMQNGYPGFSIPLLSVHEDEFTIVEADKKQPRHDSLSIEVRLSILPFLITHYSFQVAIPDTERNSVALMREEKELVLQMPVMLFNYNHSEEDLYTDYYWYRSEQVLEMLKYHKQEVFYQHEDQREDFIIQTLAAAECKACKATVQLLKQFNDAATELLEPENNLAARLRANQLHFLLFLSHKAHDKELREKILKTYNQLKDTAEDFIEPEYNPFPVLNLDTALQQHTLPQDIAPDISFSYIRQNGTKYEQRRDVAEELAKAAQKSAAELARCVYTLQKPVNGAMLMPLEGRPKEFIDKFNDAFHTNITSEAFKKAWQKQPKDKK